MLTDPGFDKDHIKTAIEKNYDISVTDVIFLPLGADAWSVVYKIISAEGEYFCKLRTSEFKECTLEIPAEMAKDNTWGILPPMTTLSGKHFCTYEDKVFTLYLFVDGEQPGKETFKKNDAAWLGSMMRQVHSYQTEIDLPVEKFKDWTEDLIKTVAESGAYHQELAEIFSDNQDQITRVIEETGYITRRVDTSAQELVVCHGDLHSANLIKAGRNLYLIDWDTIIMAPKERDLMYIGAGIDSLWSQRNIDAFYSSYRSDPDREMIRYYRLQRLCEDLVAFTIGIEDKKTSAKDRKRMLAYVRRSFKNDGAVDIALRS